MYGRRNKDKNRIPYNIAITYRANFLQDKEIKTLPIRWTLYHTFILEIMKDTDKTIIPVYSHIICILLQRLSLKVLWFISTPLFPWISHNEDSWRNRIGIVKEESLVTFTIQHLMLSGLFSLNLWWGNRCPIELYVFCYLDIYS